MIEFERGFIMLCNTSTEEECLRRSLFGDKAKRLQDLDEIKEGDIGLLLNFEKDELIGIFRACCEARLHIEPDAWDGRFAAQVCVEPVSEVKRIKDAAYILKKTGLGMKQSDLGAPIPQYPIHDRETIEKILAHFKEPNNKMPILAGQ